MSAESLTILALQQVKGANATLLCEIYRTFASFNAFVDASCQTMPGPMASLQRNYRDGSDACLARAGDIVAILSQQNIRVISIVDSEYPQLLREIHRPPVLLYIRGDVGNLSLPQVAIVGSRDASGSGLEIAESFAAALAGSGFAVTSGLALGIDAAAHRGACKTGRTVAVLGTGIDVAYPRRHRELSEQIVQCGGALVTEFRPGTPPRAENFPQRNRIISGLSLGVLIVEAAPRSGSLITARYGSEQGREVFAIPGSIHNPRARGCHQLIREGATLVESAVDIVDQLGGMLAYKATEIAAGATSIPGLSEDAATLLGQMEFCPQDMDSLVARTGILPGRLGAILAELELQGLVESRGGLHSRIK